MSCNRRDFIKTVSLSAAALAAPRFAAAQPAGFNPSPANGWRVFEVTTRLELPATNGAPRAWVPLPSVEEAAWFRPMGNLWQGNAAAVSDTPCSLHARTMARARATSAAGALA